MVGGITLWNCPCSSDGKHRQEWLSSSDCGWEWRVRLPGPESLSPILSLLQIESFPHRVLLFVLGEAPPWFHHVFAWSHATCNFTLLGSTDQPQKSHPISSHLELPRQSWGAAAPLGRPLSWGWGSSNGILQDHGFKSWEKEQRWKER